MISARHIVPVGMTAISLFGLVVCAESQTIVNGGFESGFSSWTRSDQLGSDGTFFIQSGTASPVNGFPVAAPPEGLNAAMTDAQGPGSHVLYQDFVIPASPTAAFLAFHVFVNNGAANPLTGDAVYESPLSLDFATPTLNQQARVDIMTTVADPFDVGGGGVLLNLFQTNPGDPAVFGYDPISTNVAAFLQAHAGETLRIRFAETDNVGPFNLGVDNVRFVGSAQSVPEPSAMIPAMCAAISLAFVRRRRRD